MIVFIYFLAMILLYAITFFGKGIIVDFGLVWPLFLVSLGLDHWYRNRNLTKVGMTFVYVGIFYLLMNIGIYGTEGYRFSILAYILVMMVTYLLQNLTYSFKYGYERNIKSHRKLYFTLIRSKSHKIEDDNFKGLIAINILGGMEFDLTKVKLGDDKVTVSTFSFCGESSVTLPKRLNVVVIPSTLFGDTTIVTKEKNSRYKKCVFVKTFSLLCSTDVLNKEITYDD